MKKKRKYQDILLKYWDFQGLKLGDIYVLIIITRTITHKQPFIVVG